MTGCYTLLRKLTKVIKESNLKGREVHLVEELVIFGISMKDNNTVFKRKTSVEITMTGFESDCLRFEATRSSGLGCRRK